MRNPRNEPLTTQIGDTRLPRSRAGGREEVSPERKCVLTGETGSRDELVRLALSPEGAILPDALARAPGRGAWIGVSRDALEAAQASGKLKAALARAFRNAHLMIPHDLGALTESALTRAFLQRLGLEMRAGRIVLGTDRISEQARGGAISWLGHARDAGEDGCRKLDQAFRVGRDVEGSGLGGIRLPLDRAALSVALGRDNVVHLALADPASAERVAIPLRRLMRFTGAIPAAEKASGDEPAENAGHPAVMPGSDRAEATN